MKTVVECELSKDLDGWVEIVHNGNKIVQPMNTLNHGFVRLLAGCLFGGQTNTRHVGNTATTNQTTGCVFE
jgi:hypothetical protein